jgi:hypothetical protein
MEPLGVGARDLSECLVLQLRAGKRCEAQMIAILISKSHLELLARRDAKKLMAATGLVLLLDGVQDRREDYLARIDEQVLGNDELQQMVHGLERRYDAYMAGRDPEDGSYDEGGFNERDLPSADELAAELERYLASRPSGDEDKPGRG